MNRKSYRINVTGKNSNEIYSISYPDNLIKFITYDFTPFMEKCVELCRISMKGGRISREKISVLRNSIVPCHKYVEKNIHGVFEKIVIDCWIDYICRQNKIDEPTLWNSFFACRNDFESALFARLCEFRYNRAINQWTNIVRVQEYARKKTDFIFGKKLENQSVAIANAGYFDLLFNIAANELGCGELSANKVYAGLRIPNSPFVMAKLSRDIIKRVLPGLNADDDIIGVGDIKADLHNSDKSAMDVFAAIKNAIPSEPDSLVSVNTIMRVPHMVYIPEGIKAAIDLEIDMLLESGSVIQRCDRCYEYFLKDENYNYNYCSRVENGRTCLDVVGEKMAARTPLHEIDTTLLYARCDQLYKEMSERVNVDITQRDFSDWYKYMALIRENVASGQASMDDFESFAEYSRSISFASKMNTQSPKKTKRTFIKDKKSGVEREVRAFEFERIERRPVTVNPYQQIQQIPRSAPIPYAAPTKTTRVIRGVNPSGVKDLSQVVAPQPQPLVEVKAAPAQQPQRLEPVPNPLPEQPHISEFAEFTETIKPESETQTPSVSVSVPSPRVESPAPVLKPPQFKPIIKKPGFEVQERRPKTRINKYGKGLLLQNPHEKGMLQNPFIRDLINSENDEKKVTIDAQPILRELNEDEPKNIEALPEIEVSSEAPQLDFNRILSGIQRNDGFESNADSATEDVVVSHKTKRVMDTVFGNNMIINPFVKSGEKDE